MNQSPMSLIKLRHFLIPVLIFFTGIGVSALYTFANQYKLLSYAPRVGFVLGLFAVLLFAYNITSVLLTIYKNILQNKGYEVEDLFKIILKNVKFIFCIIAINIIISTLTIPTVYQDLANKTIYMVLICLVAWSLIRLLSWYIHFNHNKLTKQQVDISQINARMTKLGIIQKIGTFIIVLLAVALSLMLFDQIRTVGISMLASAGFLSFVLGLAAQKPLSSMFTSFQLAFTQPIKIGDALIVENEYGTVEEIYTNYVLVRLWDMRRLILPVNYFIEKPFQNLTLVKSSLITTVMLYLDYTAPIDELRAELTKILEHSKGWDGNVAKMHLTEFKTECIQLRIILSSDSPDKLFDLGAGVREGLLKFIMAKHPYCLPTKRQEPSREKPDPKSLTDTPQTTYKAISR